MHLPFSRLTVKYRLDQKVPFASQTLRKVDVESLHIVCRGFGYGVLIGNKPYITAYVSIHIRTVLRVKNSQTLIDF